MLQSFEFVLPHDIRIWSISCPIGQFLHDHKTVEKFDETFDARHY